MEGVEFRVRATRQGESVHYVPMKEPSTDQVESLSTAMQEVGCSTQDYHDGGPTSRSSLDLTATTPYVGRDPPITTEHGWWQDL